FELILGYCLHLSTSSYLNQENCSFFVEGCPDLPYLSNNIYQYPRCQQIDNIQRCFLADPSCIKRTSSVISTTPFEKATNTSFVSFILFNTSTSSGVPPISDDEHSMSGGLLVVIVLCPVVVAAIIVSVLLFVYYKRRRRFSGSKIESGSGEETHLLQVYPNSEAHWPTHHRRRSDVEVQEEGGNLHIRFSIHRILDDDTVRWQKDGQDIQTSDSEKYISISHRHVKDRHIHLNVYNTTNLDSGVYTAIWKEGDVEHKRDVSWQKQPVDMLRQYGNDICIRVTTNHPPSEVTWFKDGKTIKYSDNPNKYLSVIGKDEDDKHFFLYILESDLSDSGSYKASWTEVEDGVTLKCGSSEVKIHLEALRLTGPNIKVEKDKTLSQRVDKMKNTIFSKDRTYHLVITKCEASTKKCTLDTFSHFEDDDIRRLLLFGVLLSEGQRIKWNNKAHLELLDDIRKLMKHMQQITINDYKDAANTLSGSSLLVDEKGIYFVNEEIELQTMWALMQNHNSKGTIAWLFEHEKRDIVLKYLRTPDYEIQNEETCVFLPDMLCDDFREFLIQQFIEDSGVGQMSQEHRLELLEMKKEGYIFNQRQSTFAQCAIYYTFIAGDKAPDCLGKYFRTSGYEPQEKELCICVPSEYNADLIKRMDIDILTHKTMSDTKIHTDISNKLHVPEEVMSWNLAQRQRFVKHFKDGNIEMYRARGMIVGCAGAGKTTLLRRLQRRNRKDLKKETTSTIGLEVHDNIFLIDSDTIEDYSPDDAQHESSMENPPVNLHVDRKLLSMTDFAGQVAYYACHQIYLSRRAFYILVVDMSKDLKGVAYQKDRHDPMGSLFENWTYEDYFVFWLRSIKTYCDDEKMEEKYGDKAGPNPVILIASHHDRLKRKHKTSKEESYNSFYDKLENCLPKEHTLKDHISTERYFEIECPKGSLREEQAKAIEDIRKCIVQTAKSLPHWGEKIPVQWSIFEHYVRSNKKKKIVAMEELKSMDEFRSMSENDIDDMLRFYQEIGQIIYFSDKGLREHIILDVQWFVDAFKNIITDPFHVHAFCRRVMDWDLFMKTGRISDSTLHKVWRKNNKESYISERDKIMPYMEKLGILAKIRTQAVERKKHEKVPSEHQTESVYYIPSINKTDVTKMCKEVISNGNKTPILIFSFKTYLPHFFFYRLVVTCFSVWDSLSDDLFCKNLTFYKEKGGDRNIAIGVNKTSIHLQVFTPGCDIELTADKTREIRKHVETMIQQLATTFHQKALYEVGYACKDLGITEKDEDCFLTEKEVKELETNERVCPRYYKINHWKHNIVRDNLLHYWFQADVATNEELP
ncbi:uncharacterized protein LOC134251454, partial [Saccostrea cucullata]|uniref:uncharacterized protein LOC134251454 n=1 Tax=Saccostrea cuccullata TaxID=36930 RepID=UPI002ED49C25